MQTIRSRRRSLSVAIAFVSAILAACASNPDREDTRVASSDLTADAGGDAGGDQITLCHMPPGNPANLTLITVGAPAASVFEAQGDGVCSDGSTDCCLESGPTSLCTNLSTDLANCGACGQVCAGPSSGTGFATCTSGSCGITCSGSTPFLCNGACVNEQTDNDNCGACNNICFGGQSCVNGACTCPAGQTFCEAPGHFTCVSEQSDPNNCGGCDVSCFPANGFVCSAGTCVCPGGLNECGNACFSPGTNELTPTEGNFVPLSGSATLSGMASVLGTQSVSFGCVSLVTGPTSGVLTFSFTGVPSNEFFPVPASCSYTYTDASGLSYGSTIIGNSAFATQPVNGSVSFDGDTYTCSASENGGAPGIDLLCGELGGHDLGVTAKVTLSVTRSTGAVSLARTCTYAGTCVGGFPPVGVGDATIFNLSGSLLSCGPDAGAD